MSSGRPREEQALHGREQDTRELPSFAAGSVALPRLIEPFDEIVHTDTAWASHSHPTHELLWNERGASSATVGARTWTITPFLGLWMPAGLQHSGSAAGGTWYRATHFDVGSTEALSERAVAVEVTPLLRLLLERLDDPALTAASRQLTEALVLDVIAPAQREITVLLPSAPLVQPIVRSVRGSLAAPRSLESWAEELGASPRTITRIFRAETGLGFGQWLGTVRAQRAVHLLAQGGELDEVAESVGYSSLSAFGAAFRRVTGSTPGAFRDVRNAT